MRGTVVFLVQGVLVETLGEKNIDLNAFVQTGNVLCARIQRMPLLLKAPLTVLTMVFNYAGFIPFKRKAPQARLRQIAQWRQSPLGPCRELIGFYDKMTLFIYFSLCPLKK